MILHIEINNEDLKKKIKQKEICFGGNLILKSYGTLHCTSGKRMKRENRGFLCIRKRSGVKRFQALRTLYEGSVSKMGKWIYLVKKQTRK